MALDIKTAAELATLIPSYDGSPGGLRSFIDAVNLSKTVVPAANKQSAIQIIMTKLSGKARNLFANTPNEFDDIITMLKANCEEKGNSDLALANLKNVKLKSPDDVQQFTKQVDLLADKLAQTYVREQIPNDVAKRMSQKAAIQTLINGSSNKETKMMLKISKFDNLQEAINVMVENEQMEHKTVNASVLQTNNRQTTNYQNRNNFQNRNSLNRNQQTSNRYHQPPNRYQSRPGNFNRNFNNSNNPRRFQNRNFNQHSNRFVNRQYIPTRMYYAHQQIDSGQPTNEIHLTAHGQQNYAQLLANNVPIGQQNSQQLPMPPTANGKPNYFLARQ